MCAMSKDFNQSLQSFQTNSKVPKSRNINNKITLSDLIGIKLEITK